MKKRNRVFLVTGAFSAISALAIIEEDKHKGHIYNNYAFITSVSVSSNDNDDDIINATQELLKSGVFLKIENISDIDSTVRQLYNQEKYMECESLISKRINLNEVHELFLSDNARNITLIMAGRAFDDAYIVNFGDACGIMASVIGVGFCHIDENRMFIPIDSCKRFASYLPLKVIDKTIFYTIAETFYNKNRHFKNAIDSLVKALPNNKTLLLTSYFSDYGKMDFEKENELYLNAVNRNCKPGDTIVIRPHPRDKAKKRSAALTERLINMGYNVMLLNETLLNHIPIEIICHFITFKKAVAPASASAISLKYFFGMETDLSLHEDDFNNIIKGRIYTEMNYHEYKTAHEKLDGWKGDGLLHAFETAPYNYKETSKSAAYISYEEFYCKITTNYYMKKIRLADFFTENNINKIAVYGIGQIGSLIADDLMDSKKLMVYLIDRGLCGEKYKGKHVYCLDSFKEEVDCVLIAINHSLDTTKDNIRRNINCKHIYSLCDL